MKTDCYKETDCYRPSRISPMYVHVQLMMKLYNTCLLSHATTAIYKQCSKLSQESCQSSCLESQIINIELRKIFKKVLGPPPKLSASGRRTGSNLEHCYKPCQENSITWIIVNLKTLATALLSSAYHKL